MINKPQISIILPVHNQADHIYQTVAEYVEKISVIPNTIEIILVVNGCSDNSAEKCRELEHDFPELIRCIEIEGKGWGFAVSQGLGVSRGDLICYTNSARTSGKDLLLFLLYSLGNKDVVIKASRKIRDDWKRRLGSLLYNLEARSLFNLAYWDINGTPKVFPRKFDKLLNLSQQGDLIDLEFNVICEQENYPMIEIPIVFAQNRKGKSTTNINSAFRMYFGAYQMWKEIRRKKRIDVNATHS